MKTKWRKAKKSEKIHVGDGFLLSEFKFAIGKILEGTYEPCVLRTGDRGGCISCGGSVLKANKDGFTIFKPKK